MGTLLFYRIQEWLKPGSLDRLEREIQERTGEDLIAAPIPRRQSLLVSSSPPGGFHLTELRDGRRKEPQFLLISNHDG